MYKREETITRMNALGAGEKPFFFVLSYDLEHNLIFPVHEESRYSRLASFDMPLGKYEGIRGVPELPPLPHFQPLPPAIDRYAEAFSLVQSHLLRGDSYLLNLCVSTPVDTNLETGHFFRHARSPYRMLLAGDPSVSGVHGRGCVCFSPEPFVKICGREISTFPMKGTAPEDSPEARLWLETDEKENRESATIVDLMRNDLSLVASGVYVRRYRYISSVETMKGRMLQCSSEVVGTLPEDWRLGVGTLMMSLLPAGSVTGAPKEETCRIIAEAEKMERGYYTGIFGCFNGRDLESAVSIRFLEETQGGLVYKSGGGITVMSRMEDEYRETIAKVYVPFDF